MLYTFFFNDTATTEIYTLSLHDALPISAVGQRGRDHPGLDQAVGLGFRHVEPRLVMPEQGRPGPGAIEHVRPLWRVRSEEHTSELQSRQYLVCRLLLEKKKAVLRTPQQS